MWAMMEKLGEGDAEVADIDKLLDVTKQVEGIRSARSATPRRGRSRA